MFARHGYAEGYSAERYTPTEFADAARKTLGRIDLDPASCEPANDIVQAARYYTREEDGLSRIWGGRVFLNAPNDRRGHLVREFWRRANEHAIFGGPGACVLWTGFSLEQLRTLQDVGDCAPGHPCPAPQEWPCVHVATRIAWLDGKTLAPLPQPPQANFFALLGGTQVLRRRFRQVFGQFGKYSAGSRGVPPISRNLEAEILDTLCDGPRSASELARDLAARKARVLRAVHSLCATGVLERTGRGRHASVRLSRPASRGDCPETRPCPWVGCRYHLALTVRQDGSLQVWTETRGPGRPKALAARALSPNRVREFEERVLGALEDMPHTCALDAVTDREIPLTSIGSLLGCGESGAREALESALRKLRITQSPG